MKTLHLTRAVAAALCFFAGPSFPETTYHIETIAGGRSPDAPAAAQPGDILGVAADRWGNVYFADTDHHRICRLTAGGVLSTVAGTGYAGFEGDGGPATAATLNFPYGVSVDSQGNVYVADLGNDRVRRIGLDGVITTVAGNGSTGALGDGGKATAARLLSPRNVVLDTAGNLYLSEFRGHRVRRVAPDGAISTVAGTGAAGFRGDASAATAAQLAYPSGLALDGSGNLYIADSQNHRVRKVSGGMITTFAGGDGDTMPISLAADPSGNVYIGDGSARVRKLSASGQVLGDDGVAAGAGLTAAHDLAVDPAGNLYIADTHHISQVAASGVIQTVVGDVPVPYPGDAAAAVLAGLSHPAGVAVDARGNLYIAEAGGNQIRRVTPDGNLTTVAGVGAPGFGGDGGPAATASLNGPTGVALDPSGNLFVADTQNHRLREVAVPGWIRTLAGTGTPGSALWSPRAVATDGSGNVYLADTGNHRILRFAPSGLVTVVAGTGSRGDTGDGGPAILARLNEPGGVALDAAGNLYIADTANHRVRKVDAAGVIGTIAGTGVADDRLQSPGGIAADAAGNVFVADTGNHRIRVILPNGSARTIAGTGVSGFSGDGGAAELAQLNSPLGLALDGAGGLLVADSGNNRVRRLTADGQGPAPIEDAEPTADVSLVNAASLQAGPVAPGESISIFAAKIGPERGVTASANGQGSIDTSLGDVRVLFDGRPAPLFYVQARQINAQVPYSVAGQSSVQLEIQYQGVPKVRSVVPVAESAPGIFTAGNGAGAAVAINEDGSMNSEANAAARGSLVTIFATGEGQTGPPGMSGEPAHAPYPRPTLPVSLRIGGNPAEIQFAGGAPGFVGLLQINARVPSGFAPSGNLELVLTVGKTSSQSGVTLSVK